MTGRHPDDNGETWSKPRLVINARFPERFPVPRAEKTVM